MERVDAVLGNVRDDDRLARAREAHADAGTLERVIVPVERRRRSRFRTTTDAGTDVGIVLDRPALSPGDVLLLEDDRMIVVAFEPVDALAVDLPVPTPDILEAAVKLGHRVGNQHWNLAIRDGSVYVPLEADRRIVERVVSDVVPDAPIRGTTVDAELFVSDPSAGSHSDSGDDHGHVHEDGHTHGGHDHSHGADHGHAYGGNHSHEHPHDHGRGDGDR